MSRVGENPLYVGHAVIRTCRLRAAAIVSLVAGFALLSSTVSLAATISERGHSRYKDGFAAGEVSASAPMDDTDAAGYAEAQTGIASAPAAAINAGDDLWITPCGGSIVDLSANPLPADFFGAGSDPFSGVAVLQGNPLSISPGLVPFAPVDTIVRRGATSAGFTCPGSETIPIEIVALDLVSCAPITVTYNGGQSSELWDLRVCLDRPQTGGQMTINHECQEGGSYNALLPVSTQVTATRISPAGSAGPITRSDTFLSNGWWTHNDLGGFGLSWMPTLPLRTQFDSDCDGIVDTLTVNGAVPDFFPGQTLLGCTSCTIPATGVEKELTPEQALLAAHGVLVANPEKPQQLVTQACCLADGSCIDVIPSICPGTAMGSGTSCATTTCPAPQPCPPPDPTDPNEPCASLAATDCVPPVAGALCRPSFVQVDAAGASATECDCFIEGLGCGPINISADGLTVSCPGSCQPPQTAGPCVIFYTDAVGDPVSTGWSSAPTSDLPSNVPLWCECDPLPTGACCFDDGTCSVTTQAGCTGGTWAGAGTDCSNIVACCIDDAAGGSTCEEIPDVCCEIRAGTANGTSCGEFGACCDADGNCEDTFEACCAGPFYAGQTCSFDVGACCFDADGIGGQETCVVMNRTCCEGMGGLFHGDGTTCGGVGACCTDPDVDGVLESCENMDRLCCAAVGGVFDGGGFCSGDQACCFDDATCDNVDPLCCKASGGNPQGAGSVCDTDTCVPPDLTCPLPPPYAAADICAGRQAEDCQTDDPATLSECLPKCVEYDPITGVMTAIECACVDADECHVDTHGGAPAGGLRTSHNPCEVVDNGSGTVHLPPDGCEYLSPDEVHQIIDGLPAGTTIELGAIHKEFICRQACGTPGSNEQCVESGGTFGPDGEIECFDSTLELSVNVVTEGRSLNAFPRTIVIPNASVLVHTGARTPGDAVQTFPNEMFRLEGALPAGDPDFDTLHIVAGLDFGLPSPGHTTLTRLGTPGSNFAVDSFFDITYRIDFEGSSTGALAGASGSTTGTVLMQTGSAPACVGGCPDAAQTCEQKITDVDGDGLQEICCVCDAPQTEACCLPDGTCIDVPLGECACVYHGIPLGVGTDCSTAECPIEPIWTGMNIDIHQDNPDVTANDFHIEGIIESSAVPVVVDHIDDSFPTFDYLVWQGDPACPVGDIFWCFEADWSGADYPFCTTLHLGLVFEVVCHNVMIDLIGWWTVDGDPVGGARDITAQAGHWPIIGFDVEDNIRVQPNPDPPDPRGQNIRLKNGSAASQIPVEIISLQLAAIGSSGLDGILGPRPLGELREGGREQNLPWVPVLDPTGALVSPTNPTQLQPEDEIMVLLRPAPGRSPAAGEYTTETPIDIPPGGYLIAKQLVRFDGNGPARAEEVHWFWELHGAHTLPLLEACCLPDGTCTSQLPADCICAGGTPQGPGSVCTAPVACCFDDGTCDDLDPLCCEDRGGTPQLAGSTCLGNGSDDIDDACQPPELVCPLPVTSAPDPCAGLQDTDCPLDVLPTTTECKPRCVVYNAATGTTTVTDCECMEGDDCYVKVETDFGLRSNHNPCEVIDNGSGTVTLPPDGCDYLSPEEVHMIIDGLPAGTTIELAPIHTDFICSERADAFPGCPPPGVCEEDGGDLGGQVDCFDSVLKLSVQGNGPPLDGFSRTLYPQLLCQAYTAERTENAAVQDFDTEMFRCEGEIFGDPDFCIFRVRAGRHFGLPSPGHTTLTRLGSPGSNFVVDSFFDIEYQIEFEGCPGSVLQDMSGITTGTIHKQTGNKPSCVNQCPAPQVCVERVTDLGNGTEEICCICEEPVELCPVADDRCSDRQATDCVSTGATGESCLVHAWVVVDGPTGFTADVDECACLEPGGCGAPELTGNIISCPDVVCPVPPVNERCQVIVDRGGTLSARGPSVDVTTLSIGDRITCDCAATSIIVSPGPAVGVHVVKKNRLLSIDPSTNEGGGRDTAAAVAIEVSLSSMLRCSADLRRNCKVDADCPGICSGDSDIQCVDDAICTANAAGVCVPSGPCVEHPDVGTVTKWVDEPFTKTCLPLDDCVGETFANLRSTPLFRNWTESVVHVLDCEVVPAATYQLRSWDGSVFSPAPLTIGTVEKSDKHYADCVGPVSGGQFTAPDGFTNVLDIQAYLIANRGGVTAPHTTWVDIHGVSGTRVCELPDVACIVPQQVLNVSDLQTIKFGFTGNTYPETPGQNDPGSCP